MHKPIFELLRGALSPDGRIDLDFDLPIEPLDKGCSFGPGAFDGLAFYHTKDEVTDDDPELKALIDIATLAAKNRTGRAMQAMEAFANEYHIFPYVEALQRHLVEDPDRYSPNEIGRFAIKLLFEAWQKEAVKLGLVLLALVDISDDESLADLVHFFGIFEEFTLYCGNIICSWEGANQELFELLPDVSGWGRIHLVRMFHPETERMKLWLLENGVDNGILENYSALECYAKTDFLRHLREPLSHELFTGMRRIMLGLIREEALPGISVIPEREEVISEFLRVMGGRADLVIEDYEMLIDLIDYISDEEYELAHLMPLAERLLDRQARIVASRAMEEGKGFSFACMLGMEFQPQAFKMLEEKGVQDNEMTAFLLIENGYRVEEVLDLLRAHPELPAYDPSSPDYDPDATAVHGFLDAMLKALWTQPGKGEDFVCMALDANDRLKGGAMYLMEEWTTGTGWSLMEVSPRVYQHLAEVAQREKDADMREEMMEVLQGAWRKE